MNIKKILKQKIGFYEKQVYTSVFYKLLSDLSNNKFLDEKKLFNPYNKLSSTVMWSKLTKAIESDNEEYDIPKIVYRYLLIKAKETYSFIVKLSLKEKYNVKDILKMYIENSIKTAVKKGDKKPIVYSMSSRKGSSKVIKRQILEQNNEEKEVDEEDEEIKKRNAMKKFTNIFIGSTDFNSMNKKNQQIKIFEGQYCKTFIIVDKEKPKTQKLEVKTFASIKRPYKSRENTMKTEPADIDLLKLSSHKLKVHSANISPIKLPLLKSKNTINTLETNRRTINSTRIKINMFNTITDNSNHEGFKKLQTPKTREISQFCLKENNSSTLVEFETKYGLNLKSLKSKR